MSRTGFLVVLSQADQLNSSNPSYRGVDRVPPYDLSGVGDLASTMDDYVFGEIKQVGTNLIDSYEKARMLFDRLQRTGAAYEIIAWSSDSDCDQLVPRMPPTSKLQVLGHDVAAIDGDYWSIVGDIRASAWTRSYRAALNAQGLLPDRQLAEAYLEEYRRHAEADSDMSFEVGLVVHIEVQ